MTTTNDTQLPLAERFRPRILGEVIGQEAITRKLNALRPRGLGGRAFWISGPSGCGKTSIARIIAGELADDLAIEEYKARSLDAKLIDKIARGLRCRCYGARTGRVAIINEVHGISRETLESLLDETDNGRIPNHAAWIFTTTNEGLSKFEDHDDANPLLSRCIRLPLAQRGLTEAFAARLVSGARECGLLNGKGDDYYLARAKRLLKDNRNNLRAAWQAVDSGYLTEADHEGGVE